MIVAFLSLRYYFVNKNEVSSIINNVFYSKVNTEAIYEDATGVNIQEQYSRSDLEKNTRAIGYIGEYQLFTYLLQEESEKSKILMNIEIPSVRSTNTTEIDSIFIHPFGVYVFECKHYKGSIYGTVQEEYWTQYFKTQKNERFYNPVQQNKGHIDSLRALLGNDVPLFSIILFTNPACKLHIKGITDQNTFICTLIDIPQFFVKNDSIKRKELSEVQINNIFQTLERYSNNSKDEEQYGSVSEMDRVSAYYNALKERERILRTKYNKKEKLFAARAIAATAATVLLFTLFSGSILTFYKKNADETIAGFHALSEELRAQADAAITQRDKALKQYDEMNQKFMNADHFSYYDATLKDDFAVISNLIITDSPDFEDAVDISFTVEIDSTSYSVGYDKNAALIIRKNDGSIIEKQLYDEVFRYSNLFKSHYYPSFSIKKNGILNLNASEIKYIKLVNLSLNTIDEFGRMTVLRDDFEINIYSAS